MIQPIDQKTLDAIGGQKTGRSLARLSQTILQSRQISDAANAKRDELDLAEEQWKTTKKLTKQKTESADLDIQIKRMELVGRSAIGTLELLGKDNPEIFPQEYAAFREQQPESVRKYMPDATSATAMDGIKDWAKMTAMQSEQGVPYLKAKKVADGTKFWQYKVEALAAVRNKTANNDQQAQVEYMYAMTPGGIQAPTTGQIESALISIQKYQIGEDNLVDLLDKDSLIAMSNAIANDVKILAEQARQDRTPALMQGSNKKAIDGILARGNVVPVETILGSENLMKVADKFLPKGWADEVSNKSLVYIENPEGFSEAANAVAEQEAEAAKKEVTPVPPAGLKAGETRILGGYIWRINPKTGIPESKPVGN